MRNLLVIIFTLLVCGCQRKQSNTINCPNNIVLMTTDSETIINNVGLFVEDYMPCVSNIEQQCPLFRCIQTNEYNIYVALPVQLSSQSFKDACVFSDMTCVDSVYTDTVVYKYWKSDNKEIAQLLYHKNKSSILMVGVPVNQNKSTLSYDALVRRIQTKL